MAGYLVLGIALLVQRKRALAAIVLVVASALRHNAPAATLAPDDMKQRLQLDRVELPLRPVELEGLFEATAEMNVVFEDRRVRRAARQKPAPDVAMAERQRRLGAGNEAPRGIGLGRAIAARPKSSPVDRAHKKTLDTLAAEFPLHPCLARRTAREIDDVDGNHGAPPRRFCSRRHQMAFFQRVTRRAQRWLPRWTKALRSSAE